MQLHREIIQIFTCKSFDCVVRSMKIENRRENFAFSTFIKIFYCFRCCFFFCCNEIVANTKVSLVVAWIDLIELWRNSAYSIELVCVVVNVVYVTAKKLTEKIKNKLPEKRARVWPLQWKLQWQWFGYVRCTSKQYSCFNDIFLAFFLKPLNILNLISKMSKIENGKIPIEISCVISLPMMQNKQKWLIDQTNGAKKIIYFWVQIGKLFICTTKVFQFNTISTASAKFLSLFLMQVDSFGTNQVICIEICCGTNEKPTKRNSRLSSLQSEIDLQIVSLKITHNELITFSHPVASCWRSSSRKMSKNWITWNQFRFF